MPAIRMVADRYRADAACFDDEQKYLHLRARGRLRARTVHALGTCHAPVLFGPYFSPHLICAHRCSKNYIFGGMGVTDSVGIGKFHAWSFCQLALELIDAEAFFNLKNDDFWCAHDSAN